MFRRRISVVIVAVVGLGCPVAASSPSKGKNVAVKRDDGGRARGPCPTGMAYVTADDVRAFCIDRWEAHVVEVDGKREVAHPPTTPVTGLEVRAATRSGVIPQGYISKVEAEAACQRANKRLCAGDEWERACRGKSPTTFPYGDDRKAGYCNDSGRAPLRSLYPELGDEVYASNAAMNDPRINQAPNTVAPTGSYAKCRNTYGVYDMVGNLHEWVADVRNGHGTFRGGYYQDTHKNGDGCGYRTVAHGPSYHDYSTGFRCCADPK